MMRKTNAKYRALERIDTEELTNGFEDENRNPLEFDARAVTYYDDKFWICYEETNSSRLKAALKDKKRKENEIPTRDTERAGVPVVLPGV